MPLNPGRNSVFLIAAVICLFTAMQALAQQTAVRSELSSDTITRDESVTLTITAIGLDGELDASSLNKDFEVVGRSSSRQVSTVTGSNNQAVTTSVVTWALELLPRDVGVFTVPAVSVRGQKSPLLTLTVNEIPSGAKRDIFVEATVDTQEPWVQSQVTMTLRVYQAIDIVDGGLDVPVGDDLVVERIGEDSREAQLRDGRQYSVTERRFALFPQKSGITTIEPITLSVTVPAEASRVRGFFSPTRKITRRTSPITLNVQARPPNGPLWWLPARKVQLERTWSGDPDAAQVDQPLTRSIVLRATGVLDSQLPDIEIPAIEGLSLYAEQPVRAMAANEAGLIAEQRINWAIIPQRAGELVLPAINIEWFNTQTGNKETAVLAAETISVKASSASAGTDSASVSSSDSLQSHADTSAITQSLLPGDTGVVQQESVQDEQAMSDQIAELENSSTTWRNAAVAALALWLVSAALFFYRRFRFRPEQGLGAVRSKGQSLYSKVSPLAGVEASCKEGDLTSVQRSLLEWSSRQWADQAPLTLSSLAQKIPESDARTLVRKLDAALYSPRVDVGSTDSLSDMLQELPEKLKQAMTESDSVGVARKNSVHSLPPL